VHSNCDGVARARKHRFDFPTIVNSEREREKDPTNTEKVPLSDALGVPEARLFYASPSVLLIPRASRQREVT